jgi:hypothetical protein
MGNFKQMPILDPAKPFNKLPQLPLSQRKTIYQQKVPRPTKRKVGS